MSIVAGRYESAALHQPVEREGLLMGFAAGTNSAAVHQSLERFALSFADESVFGDVALRGWASTIRRIDTSSYDHLLPDKMRPTD